MADRVRVDVDGVDKVIAALTSFRVRARDLSSAWQDIGQEVKRDAVVIAPVLTGRLESSIRAGRTKSRAIVRAGNAAIEYAGVIHYGGYTPPGAHSEIVGQPFLVIAVQQNRGYAIERLNQEISHLIRSRGLK